MAFRRTLHLERSLSLSVYYPRRQASLFLRPSLILPKYPTRRNLSTDTSISTRIISFSESAADHMQAFHESIPFDCPWSLTIPITSLAIRGISLPFLYHNQLHRDRSRLAAKEQARIQHFVRNTPGTLFEKYKTYRRLNSLALRSAGTSNFRQFRWHLAAHFPLIISASLGMRELSTRAENGWSDCSFMWLSDMASADPTAALPMLTTALWLWNLEPGVMPTVKLHPVQRATLNATKFMLRSFQVFCVVSFAVISELPSGLVLFWTCNGLLTTGLRYALGSESVRKQIGLLTDLDIKEASGPPVLRATEQAFEQMRAELAMVQRKLLDSFDGRKVDEKLCDDVNRILRRERMSGRMVSDLRAVIRRDEENGRAYVAVVRSGS